VITGPFVFAGFLRRVFDRSKAISGPFSGIKKDAEAPFSIFVAVFQAIF
jgi:hypothetical protein